MSNEAHREIKNFPLTRKSERDLPKDYGGYVYIWDIDGTYLNTDISSKLSLAKILFKKASERTNIPASDLLLRHLRIGSNTTKSKLNPIYFITASPPQLEKQITQKMAIDKVQYDGIIYKDLLGVISNFELDELATQLTYKLAALLTNRAYLPVNSKEILFGDNLEQDSLIYSLYDKLLDRDSDAKLLKDMLLKHGVKDGYINGIMEKSAKLIERSSINPIDIIYIHQTEREKTNNESKEKLFSDKIIPVINFFQASAHLYERGHISLNGVAEVFKDSLIYRHNRTDGSKNFTKEKLLKSLQHMRIENYLKKETEEEILNQLL